MCTFKKTKYWEVMKDVTDKCQDEEIVTIMTTMKKYTIFHFTSSQVERINAMAKSIMDYHKSPFTEDDKYIVSDDELHSIQFWEEGKKSFLPCLRGGTKLYARVVVQIIRFTQTEEDLVKYKIRINDVAIEKMEQKCPFTFHEEVIEISEIF